jgi:hypothetical protein
VRARRNPFSTNHRLARSRSSNDNVSIHDRAFGCFAWLDLTVNLGLHLARESFSILDSVRCHSHPLEFSDAADRYKMCTRLHPSAYDRKRRRVLFCKYSGGEPADCGRANCGDSSGVRDGSHLARSSVK